MKIKILLVLLLIIGFMLVIHAGYSQETLHSTIIPKPMKTESTGGFFVVKPTTRILVEKGSPEIMAIGKYLADKLNVPTGYKIQVEEDSEGNRTDCIELTTTGSKEFLGEEGYELLMSGNSVVLRAFKPCGLFWGMQTLRQLLPLEIESNCLVQKTIEWTIPCMNIEDKPRYQWRGFMMDCSRTFLTKEYLKRYIDLLAYYKLNRFHLHLTDDQGWRVEIKKYPKLTEIGAWAVKNDGVKEGGYYTQEDLKEIVEYARSRYVMIVPEIEMPGHSVAAVAAYPELSCKTGPFNVLTLPVTALYKEGSLCAGKETTYEFLENVISEVVALFPSPYFHIGGDECVKEHWKDCPHCQKIMQNEGLKNEEELQSYFVKRIEKILNSKNRTLIGWDEILQGGLAPNATVMSWRGIEGAIEAARSGHDAVMSPTSHCYLDYDHTKISLIKTYSFEPTPYVLTVEESIHILGVQGNMWTHIATLEPQIDAQIFPRQIALAEVGWSQPELRNWDDFSGRMENHYQRLDIMRVNYYK